MMGKKRHGSAASAKKSDTSTTVTATYFICTMPVEACNHGAMFCIGPSSLLFLFIFSISLAESKQYQDQSELNFSGYATRMNCEERIEATWCNSMVRTCNCLSRSCRCCVKHVVKNPFPCYVETHFLPHIKHNQSQL
jgi:hypothetical protein